MSQEIAENTQNIQFLQEELEKQSKADEKVRLCLDFMKKALSQSQDANFKVFWEAKAKCLEVFKEDLSLYIRERLWNEYLEINNQEKSLRAHLEKEASFAIEQIILAIDALQDETENIPSLVAKTEDVNIPQLDIQSDLFESCQKELNVLNILAEKTQSLKKEIISTQIRYRDKNQFLKKLSVVADKIYPRKKTLIHEISEAFESDVALFSKSLTAPNIKAMRLFDIKDKIKKYQGLAKVLSLNTATFTKTKADLSGLWDKIKKMDDVRRKVSSEKKELYKKNFDQVQSNIDAIIKKNCEENVEEKTLLKEIEGLLSSMKQMELAKRDIKILRDKIEGLQDEILGKDTKEKEIFEKQELQKALDLKNEALELVRSKLKDKDLLDKVNILEEKRKSLSLSQKEDLLIEDLLKTASSIIPKAEGDIHADLQIFTDFKAELKGRIEHIRKLLGGSAQDFEKAFIYQELLEKEKNLFKDLEKSIEKMEVKALE